MNEPISNHQIDKLFNNKCRCISYDELKTYKTLKQLLYPYGCAIILYIWEDKPSYNGHWIYLGYGKNKDKDKVILFDSLGKDDIDLNLQVPYMTSIRTHQDYPYLSKLILDSKMDLLYNPKQIQQSHSAVCARYSCYTARNLNKFDSFDDLLKQFNKSRLENDKLILQLTENYF
jgi:hypothetical protein